MRALAIVNARAGVGTKAALETVRRDATAWRSLEVRFTEHAGHAAELAREAVASGFEVVLAVGGDGTANEVAQGLLGSPVAMGLVPHGSGNGLARTLGIPLRRPLMALRALEDAETRLMDVGLADGRVFLNVAGVGFDAAVGAAFQAHGDRGGRRGLWSYFRVGLPIATRYRARSYALRARDGVAFEGRALLVTFANGPQFGGEAVIAPRARLDDGLLDIAVVEDTSAVEILWNAPRLFSGTIEKYKRYRRFATPSAVLTANEMPLPFHRDGEPDAAPRDLTIELAAKSLRVLVPRPTLRSPASPFRGA